MSSKRYTLPGNHEGLFVLERHLLYLFDLTDFIFILDLSLTNDGTVFYFRTNRDAPRNRVVKYDLAKPEEVKESNFF